MSDIWVKTTSGTSSSAWKKAVNIFVKTTTGTTSAAWKAVKNISVFFGTGWTRVWPLSGAYATREAWIGPDSTTTYNDALTDTSYIRIGSNYYGNNAQWDPNGFTITSYSYAWKYYPDNTGVFSGTTFPGESGTGSGWTSGGTGQDVLPLATWNSSSNNTTYDRKYIRFEVIANVSNSVYNGFSSTPYIKIVRRVPTFTGSASLSTNTPTPGTQVTYTSPTWDTTEARKEESSRTTIEWYTNSVSSTSGGTFRGFGSTYTPDAITDTGKYLYVIETRFNSGTDVDLGLTTGVQASVITTGVVASVKTPPTIISATQSTPGGQLDVVVNGGSGPAYQIYWTSISTPPSASVTPDGAANWNNGSNTTVSDPTAGSSPGTYYVYARSVTSTGFTTSDSGNNATSSYSQWSPNPGFQYTLADPTPVNTVAPTLTTNTGNFTAGSTITVNTGTWTGASSYKYELLYSSTSPISDNSSAVKTLVNTNQYVITLSDATASSYYFRGRITAYSGASQTGFSAIALSTISARSTITPSTSISVGTATSSGFTVSGVASPVSGGSAYVSISEIQIWNSSQTSQVATITTGLPGVDSITGAWSYVWSGGSSSTTYYAKVKVRSSDSDQTTITTGFSSSITTSAGVSTPTSLTATNNNGAIRLTFSGGTGDQYDIYYNNSDNRPTDGQAFADYPNVTSPYDPPLTARDVPRWFWVRKSTGALRSNWYPSDSSVTIRLPLLAPPTFVITNSAQSSNSLSWHWTQPTPNASQDQPTSWDWAITTSTSTPSSWPNNVTTRPTSGSPLVTGSLNASTTYYLHVRAKNADASTTTFQSGITSAAVLAPTNATIPTLSPTSISVGTQLSAGIGTWNNSPTSYDIRIYRGTANVGTFETLVASRSGSSTANLTYTVTQADYDSGERYFRTFVDASNSGGSSGLIAGQERGPISQPFTPPSSGTPGWSSGSNFQRIASSSILRWYTDYPSISGDGSFSGMQFEIRTTAGGGTLLASGTRSYPGAGSYPYSGGGTVWAFRCGTSDGDISYSSSARFARVRTVMLGTNGTTYFGSWTGWI